MIIRQPAAAGRFYPRFKEALLQDIQESFQDSTFGPGKELKFGRTIQKPRKVLGATCPHAGYTYSGACAAHSYQAIFEENIPDSIIILGNQHTGYNSIATMKKGVWKTPFGDIGIDEEITSSFENTIIEFDDSAFMGYPHGREHNIEVQLPFIQYASVLAKKEINIVPIKVGDMIFSHLQSLAKILAASISKSTKDIAIIASSDMTHYEPKDPRKAGEEIINIQHAKDEAVMKGFESYDPGETFKAARNTSVCGPQTITTLLLLGQALNYKHTKRLQYYTSFEKGGKIIPCDYSVGYFSGIVII